MSVNIYQFIVMDKAELKEVEATQSVQRACKHCGKALPEHARPHAQFCIETSRCRVAHHRARKAAQERNQ